MIEVPKLFYLRFGFRELEAGKETVLLFRLKYERGEGSPFLDALEQLLRGDEELYLDWIATSSGWGIYVVRDEPILTLTEYRHQDYNSLWMLREQKKTNRLHSLWLAGCKALIHMQEGHSQRGYWFSRTALEPADAEDAGTITLRLHKETDPDYNALSIWDKISS